MSPDRFQQPALGEPSLEVYGIRVTQQKGTVCLDQEQYIQQQLEWFGMGKCDPIATPADHNQKQVKQISFSSDEEREQMHKVPSRGLVGGLQFLACCECNQPV